MVRISYEYSSAIMAQLVNNSEDLIFGKTKMEENLILKKIIYISVILVYIYFLVWPLALILRIPKNAFARSAQANLSRKHSQLSAHRNMSFRNSSFRSIDSRKS